MRRVFAIVLLVCGVLFMLAAWLPFTFAQESPATISPAPAAAPDPLTVILGILLAVSEGLAFFPKIAANGVVHGIVVVLQQLARKPGVPVVLLCLMFGTLAGCGKSLDQIRTVAHSVIDIAGKVYEDVKDNVDTVKQVVTEPAPQPGK